LQFGESLPRARLTAGGGVVLAENCSLQFVHAASLAEGTADPGRPVATYKRAASRSSAETLRSCACADPQSARGARAEIAPKTMLFSDSFGIATNRLFG
jgi:hypothetical protein